MTAKLSYRLVPPFVRGSATRMLRTLGPFFATLPVLLVLVFWLGIRKLGFREIFAVVFLVIIEVALLSVVAFLTSQTVARISDRRMNFYFCGIRTRSLALD